MNRSLFFSAFLSATLPLAASSAGQETGKESVVADPAPSVPAEGGHGSPCQGPHFGKKGPDFHFNKMGKRDRQRLLYFHHLIMERYDLDRSGRLSPEEMKSLEADARKFREERHKMILAKYDKDGDGKLNEEEVAALREDVRSDMEKRLKKRHEHGKSSLGEKEGSSRSGEEEMLPPPPPFARPDQESLKGKGKGEPGKTVPMKRRRPGPEGLIFVHGHHLMMEKFDRGHKGKLSPEERKEMRKDREAFFRKWEEARKKAREENRPDPEEGPADMGIPVPNAPPAPEKE